MQGAHFGRPAQDNYQESLDWLKKQVLGKTVYCQLLRRDQYTRAVSLSVQTTNAHCEYSMYSSQVAMPYLKPRFLPGFLVRGKCVSLDMLRAGWVVTYEQSGAEYGRYPKELYDTIQQEAQYVLRL